LSIEKRLLALAYMPKNTQTSTSSPSLPAALEAILDAVQVPVPSGTLRALADVALRDRDVTAQALGRVAAYEEESFLRQRNTPRFCWAVDKSGAALSPRIWARGSWRLERRILTEDAFQNWSVTLAVFLTDKMAKSDEHARTSLAKASMEAVARVVGPVALYLPGPREEWAAFHAEMLTRQHPIGPEAFTGEQLETAKQLQETGSTPFSLYFGAQDSRVPKTEGPPGLRLPYSGEAGIPFDELVRDKATDRAVGRSVLAYLQEWGSLADHLKRSPSLQEYAERWQVNLETARRRNEEFASLFPSEETPERIWNLLWETQEPGDSPVRLIGKPVIESSLPPTVINHFVNCIVDELRNDPELGREVLKEIATFEEREQDYGREARRFFALCERTRLWSAQALVSAGESSLASSLLSIESVMDDDTASYTEKILGQYRKKLANGPHRELLLGAQKALRVAATLDALNPPSTTSPYLSGVQWAAKALGKARHHTLSIDVTKEAKATTRALESIY